MGELDVQAVPARRDGVREGVHPARPRALPLGLHSRLQLARVAHFELGRHSRRVRIERETATSVIYRRVCRVLTGPRVLSLSPARRLQRFRRGDLHDQLRRVVSALRAKRPGGHRCGGGPQAARENTAHQRQDSHSEGDRPVLGQTARRRSHHGTLNHAVLRVCFVRFVFSRSIDARSQLSLSHQFITAIPLCTVVAIDEPRQQRAGQCGGGAS